MRSPVYRWARGSTWSRKWRLVGVLSLVVALGSCGGPGFNYDGDWKGNRNLRIPDASAEMSYTLGRVTLKVVGDRFELTSGGAPETGTMRITSNGAVLEPETWMTRPLARQSEEVRQAHPPMKLTPQVDGTLLFDDPMAIDHRPLTLRREAG